MDNPLVKLETSRQIYEHFERYFYIQTILGINSGSHLLYNFPGLIIYFWLGPDKSDSDNFYKVYTQCCCLCYVLLRVLSSASLTEEIDPTLKSFCKH